MTVVMWTVGVLCGIALLLVGIDMIRDRAPGNLVDATTALITVSLIVLAVLGALRLREPHDGVEVVTWLGYLVALPLVLALAWVWSQAERTRGGTAVLALGFLTVPFLMLRLTVVWPLG